MPDQKRLQGAAVGGLALPPLLVALLYSGRWRQPEDTRLNAVLPGLDDEFDFLVSLDQIELETGGLQNSAAHDPEFWHICSSAQRHPNANDPDWVVAEKAVVIAVNREHGADVCIVLDYRSDPSDPRVLASGWRRGADNRWRHCWFAVADHFSDFVSALDL